ncbi:MAG: hypothetical protein C0601_07535 [Candidatus Muiribacterium halophilum]|uniref:DUF304 domain-containing protein n=1 Tax=Muiribacterium halophilum TaxID=2053465 RepID=A0A2N5ZFK3_MUIH1|nr:MAG: hypothetical protein C0601_07535 [Candidatus Muirbacterium halophilum]
MKEVISWKYSFIDTHKKVSALAIAVLILCFIFSYYWVNIPVLLLISFFVVVYLREFFFPVFYSIDIKKREITVKNLFFKKTHDLTRFFKVSEWKNGLFLSTMYDESRINDFRGLKLFVLNENKKNIMGVLNDLISTD